MNPLRENFSSFMEYNSGTPKAVAVACSGGADSMALTLLAHHWAAKQGVKIIALTVDHGLRAESRREAKTVAAWLKKRGIEHDILTWKGKKPGSNIQEEARKARYALLAGYCREHGITALLVAHTLEDQAETFLLRLKRGSGVDGLAAMATHTSFKGINILRPLLEVKKIELVNYLKKLRQDFIRDPSNENTAYDRIKIRKLLPLLAEAGISPEKIALAVSNMARARGYLRNETNRFLSENGHIFNEGYILLHRLPQADEIALRALAQLCVQVGGVKVPPRLQDLERLLENIKKPSFKSATLCGCIFIQNNPQTLLVMRELKAVSLPVEISGKKMVTWDRFDVSAPAGNYTIGALTQEGWLDIAKKEGLKNTLPDKRILYTLPCLRDARGKIVAVPHLKAGDKKLLERITVQFS